MTTRIAVEREIRRQAAERDVEILERVGAGDDLAELVSWSAEHSWDLEIPLFDG